MRPLEGVRIVELTDASGVLAGRLLADLGAEVIRVEPPGGGALRATAPFLDGVQGVERSYEHLAFNAGKRSVVLDLDAADGRAALRQLVAGADALIDTLPSAELASLELEYPQTSGLNPGLIHVSITPFGRTSPWIGRKGSDLIGSATGGLLHVSGTPDLPPVLAGGNMSYRLASLAACTGVLAALVGREGVAQGRGCSIDISIQECVTLSTMQTSNPNYWPWYGMAPRRNTQWEFPIVQCGDGRYALARGRPDSWAALHAWAVSRGVPVKASAEDWQAATARARGSFRLGESADVIGALAGLYGRDEFLDLAWNVGLVALPVHSFSEMRTSDHLNAIAEFITVRDEPLGLDLGFPKSAFSGLRDAGQIRRAPLLGEDTDDVLESLESRPGPVAGNGPMAAAGTDALPLEGLRVLDLTWVLAGPIGARILGNLGAEVIKVESETRMDSLRRSLAPPSGANLATDAQFNCANTAKLSATINTSTDAGRELLARLAAKCDVVVNNLRPGAVERMGINYEALRKVNPRLIVVHLPGCGRTGPWAGLPTFGNHIAAASGLNVLTGFPGTAPSGLGVAFADFVAPYLLASAVLAAVRERSRTGEGQEIEVAQLPGMISLLSAEWMEFAHSGKEPARRANRDPNYSPHGVYPAAGDDRWLAVAVRGEEEWRAFANATGRPGLATDPRFATHADRKAHEDELDAIVAEWSRPLDGWSAADLLQAAGVAAAAVEDLADQLETDPCLPAYFQPIRQPSDPEVRIVVPGETIHLAGRDRQLQRSPGLGEQNEYVFREVAGLTEEEMDGLVVAGVIG